MEFFKSELKIKFMKKRYLTFLASGIFILAGLVGFITKGFNVGIEFSGGTMVEVSFAQVKNEETLRSAMNKRGFKKYVIQRADSSGHKFFIKTTDIPINKELDNTEVDEISKLSRVSRMIDEALISEDEKALRLVKLDLNNSSDKGISDFLVQKRISQEDAIDTGNKIIKFLKSKDNKLGLIQNMKQVAQLGLKKQVMAVLNTESFPGSHTFLSSEVVGPQVGRDLRQKTVLATFWVLVGMLIYIGVRFKFIYGVASVITLAHDTLALLAFIYFFRIEFNLTIVAALLTCLGYSINDTIVIFDRVRDNIKIMRRESAEAIIDKSINQTLSRTLLTGGTTLIMLIVLYFFGGEVINGFALTMTVGIIIGTYSSIYQSCACLMIWQKTFLGRKKS